MHINIKSNQYGFFSEEPITVTRSDYAGELVWCDHAQADEEQFSGEHYFDDGTFVEVNRRFLKCYKCGAWKDLTNLNNQWEDAPERGSYE